MNENKKFFYGMEVSEEGIARGYVDYRTFAHALGSHVLCNDIIRIFNELNWNFSYEEYNDGYDEEEDVYPEVYQYYLIPCCESNTRLLDEAHEHYIYVEDYDLLIWCIHHWGTSWDYVMTDIKIDW